mmetsp:Transcript_97038/g.216437  ORF Transcript_97038/g.216437 Transcript_97038/m.216437 type:complete len:301 (-) Transcript_97038:115-1017(-)
MFAAPQINSSEVWANIIPFLDCPALIRTSVVSRDSYAVSTAPRAWQGREVHLSTDPAKAAPSTSYLELFTSVTVKFLPRFSDRAPDRDDEAALKVWIANQNILLVRLAVHARRLSTLHLDGETNTSLSTWHALSLLGPQLRKLVIVSGGVFSSLCAATNKEAGDAKCDWANGSHPLLPLLQKCSQLQEFVGHTVFWSQFSGEPSLLKVLADATRTAASLKVVDVSWSDEGVTIESLRDLVQASPHLERFKCVCRAPGRGGPGSGSHIPVATAMAVLQDCKHVEIMTGSGGVTKPAPMLFT